MTDTNNLEEGEVLPPSDYIITDSFFKFQQKKISLNWRDISSIIYDRESGLPTNCGEDPTRDILQNLESVAMCDLSQERNTRWISEEGRRAMQIL